VAPSAGKDAEQATIGLGFTPLLIGLEGCASFEPITKRSKTGATLTPNTELRN